MGAAVVDAVSALLCFAPIPFAVAVLIFLLLPLRVNIRPAVDGRGPMRGNGKVKP